MANFQINGIAYQSKLMDGEMQILVLKRLLPALTTLIGCRGAITAIQAEPVVATVPPETPAGTGPDDVVAGEAPGSIQDVLLPVARELASLGDADLTFILSACMQVTQRAVSHGVGWVPVLQRGVLQDQSDAKSFARIMIAWHVLAENFGEMLGSFGIDLSAVAKAAPAIVG